ncbi:MAG: hypothetical protein K6G65_08575 [Lachnospiraceae bacterium]|nr:hypothetical protein [Lachnospiraceae bacterium]
MNRCNNCGVRIKDQTEQCPLCNGILDGNETGSNTYPNIIKRIRALTIVYRVLMLLCAVGLIADGAVFFFGGKILKFGVVFALMILYIMWLLRISFKDTATYLSRTLWGTFFAVILLIMIDQVLGYQGWSVNYVLPGGVIFVSVSLAIFKLINHRNWQSYIIFDIGLILVSVVTAVFIYVGIIDQPLVAEISILLIIIDFVATMILGGERAKNELRRRFHVR